MIDSILDILFSNSGLIIAIGTFVRRPNPINGLCSGKIVFSKILGNVQLSQDKFGLTFSTYYPWSIKLGEIAFADSTFTISSTSSFVFRQEQDFINYNRSPRLISAGMINGIARDPDIELGGAGLGWISNCNVNGGFCCHSFIINGVCNCVDTSSCTSLIIGSRKSYITGKDEVIINGLETYICSSGECGNVIIGAGAICKGESDVIISSFGLYTCDGKYNSIISSTYKISSPTAPIVIDKSTKPAIFKGDFSSIISSCYSSINGTLLPTNKSCCVCNNLISNSRSSEMRGYGVVPEKKQLNFNSILSSNCGLIQSGQIKDTSNATDHGSCFNSLISTRESCILDSNYSSIISSQNSCISGMSSTKSNQNYQRNTRSSVIIGGYKNVISSCECWNENFSSFTTFPSSIISGYYNTVCHLLPISQSDFQSNFGGSSIISSRCSCVISTDSVILSSVKSSIGYGVQSAVISSCLSKNSPYRSAIISSKNIQGTGLSNNPLSRSSVIISSSNISESDVNGDYWSKFSTHISSGCTKIINGCFNSSISSVKSGITASKFSLIGSSCEVCIKSESYSAILSSKYSGIYGTSSPQTYNNSIISSVKSNICNSQSSSIISAYKSFIFCGCNSSILGGCCNVLGTNSVVTCNSTILGGCNLNLTFSNFSMAKNLNFSCNNIFLNSNKSYCGIVVLWTNCLNQNVCVLKGFGVNVAK